MRAHCHVYTTNLSPIHRPHVFICHLYQVAEMSGAEKVFKQMTKGQKTTFDYRDSISIAVCRLFCGPRKWRHFARLATGTGSKAGVLSNLCETAVIATVACLKRTLLRHPDRDVVDFGRAPCMGKDGEFKDVYIIIDGFAFAVQYLSPAQLHRLIHSVYKGTAVGQATILLDARLQIVAITDVYCGAASEGSYVEDSKIFEQPEGCGIWLLVKGDWVMSDKVRHFSHLCMCCLLVCACFLD